MGDIFPGRYTKKAVIVYQVGHFYFGDLDQYYFGANNCMAGFIYNLNEFDMSGWPKASALD